MRLQALLSEIERAIPPVYALDGDPGGLHVGAPSAEVERLMLALEVTDSVIDQAQAASASLLVVHHPLIFRPLKRLTERTVVERLVARLIREEIALYAMHTNLDLHPQGMAKIWGERLGLVDLKPVLPKPQAGLLKLVTFVAEAHADALRDHLAQAGAGTIGEYERCSFSHPGTGTFYGRQGTDPAVGQSQRLETEPEIRMEMVLPAAKVSAVVSALYEAHPYEEPAYDLVSLTDFRQLEHLIWAGRLEPALEWEEWTLRVAGSVPGYTGARVTQSAPKRVERVALSTGSGSACLPAVMGLGVDLYLTGELGYHLFWEAQQTGSACMAVGHYESEQFFSETVERILEPRGIPITLLKATETPPAACITP